MNEVKSEFLYVATTRSNIMERIALYVLWFDGRELSKAGNVMFEIKYMI